MPQQFYPAPTQNLVPYFPSSTQFPSESYGFGFIGNTNNQNSSGSQTHMGNQFRSRPPNGNQYRGNGFRNNNNFIGKSYNASGSSNYYSSGSRQNGNNTWSGNTNIKTNVAVECQICNKRGHIASNCFHMNSASSSSNFIVECQICGKRGHSALDCYQRSNYAFQGQASPSSLTAMNAQQTTQLIPQQNAQFIPQDSWIVDSG